jgi:LysR family hydrogen peroxide-inducible transcriptional activator
MRSAPHPVTLRQMQYLVAVAQARSFRRAAEACRVSQPSLSAQVAEAERVLGVRLFERDRHRVIVTPAGAALLARARQVLLAADDLVEEARRAADPLARTLHLGVLPTIGPYVLPAVAPALRRAFPALRLFWVEDRTAALVERVSAGDLEAAVVARESDLGDLTHVPLGSDPFLFAAARDHALAGSTAPLPLEALSGERVLLLDDGHCLRDQALAICSKAGAEELGFRATSLPTLVEMVASGLGVTLIPGIAAAAEARRSDLRVRPFQAPAPKRTLILAWRRRTALEPALRAVAEAIRSALPALARAPPRSRRPAIARGSHVHRNDVLDVPRGGGHLPGGETMTQRTTLATEAGAPKGDSWTE